MVAKVPAAFSRKSKPDSPGIWTSRNTTSGQYFRAATSASGTPALSPTISTSGKCARETRICLRANRASSTNKERKGIFPFLLQSRDFNPLHDPAVFRPARHLVSTTIAVLQLLSDEPQSDSSVFLKVVFTPRFQPVPSVSNFQT